MKQVQVGDVVRLAQSTARFRGEVVELLGGSPLTFKVRLSSGKVKQFDAIHVVEIVSSVVPVVEVAPVVVELAPSAPVVVRSGVRKNSMLGMAICVLKESGAMHVKALTAEVISRGFRSMGKTPQATLAAHLLTAEKKGLVVKVAPATFEVVS